jgi:hypothetical protein
MLNHRSFSTEFKAEAVELVISSGRSVLLPSVARWNGLNIRRLQAKNVELKREIDFWDCSWHGWFHHRCTPPANYSSSGVEEDHLGRDVVGL